MGCLKLAYYKSVELDYLRSKTCLTSIKSEKTTYRSYIYGFNGMEKDDEAKGAGNSYDFGARMLDVRLGRWLSMDSKFHEYPGFSPYNFAANSPITTYDADGKRTYFAPGLGGRTTGKVYVESISEAFSTLLGDAYVEIKTGNVSTPFTRFLSKMFQKGPLENPTYTSDALYSASRSARRPALRLFKDKHIRNTVNEIIADIEKNPLKDGEKFNLIGLSMGSINAAQAAIVLLRRGTVDKIDNLVLAGSPIDMESKLYKKIMKLQAKGKIGEVTWEPLEGDAVTGVSGTSLLNMIPKAMKMILQFNDQGADQVHEKASNDPTIGERTAEALIIDMEIEGPEIATKIKLGRLIKNAMDQKGGENKGRKF